MQPRGFPRAASAGRNLARTNTQWTAATFSEDLHAAPALRNVNQFAGSEHQPRSANRVDRTEFHDPSMKSSAINISAGSPDIRTCSPKIKTRGQRDFAVRLACDY